MVAPKKVETQKVAIARKKIGGEVPIIVNELTDKCLYTGFFGTLEPVHDLSSIQIYLINIFKFIT